jgi:hypothetical protein
MGLNPRADDLLARLEGPDVKVRLLKAPGHYQTKPIEALVFREDDEYVAVHLFPALDTDKGFPIDGRAESEDLACQYLLEAVTGYYSDMRNMPVEKTGGEATYQKRYLESLFLPSN